MELVRRSARKHLTPKLSDAALHHCASLSRWRTMHFIRDASARTRVRLSIFGHYLFKSCNRR
jgi:hypothetical protein